MQRLYISTLTEPFGAVYDMRTYVHMQHSVVAFPDRVLVSVCKDRTGPAVAQCLWLIQLSLPMLCNSGCQDGCVMATHSANWLLVCAWDSHLLTADTACV